MTCLLTLRSKNGFFAAPVAKFSQLKPLVGAKISRRRVGRRKRSKKGSNSSIDEKEMSESSLQCVTDSIDCIKKKLVTDGSAKIHEDMDKLREEFKEDLNIVKKQIGEIEESLQSTQVDVESLRNEVKNVSATSTDSFEELNERILYLEKQLKLETDRKEHAIRAVYETRELTFQQRQRNGERRL